MHIVSASFIHFWHAPLGLLVPCWIAAYHQWTLVVLMWSCTSVSVGGNWQMHEWSHHTVNKPFQEIQSVNLIAARYASQVLPC